MKKHLLLLTLLAAVPGFAATLDINGSSYAVDTIVPKHPVGPGTSYAYYRLPVRPLDIHVLEVDMTNPFIHIEVANGGGAAVATERPSSMYARNDWGGHDMVAATNGDFYTTANGAAGISRMGLIGDNEMIFNPTGTAQFVVDGNNFPWIDRVYFGGTVTDVAGRSVRLHTVNQLSLEWEPATAADQLSLFTPAFGEKLHPWTTGGNIAVLRPASGDQKFPANVNLAMVVDSVAPNGGTPVIPRDGCVLSGVGASADFVAGLKPGQVINLFLGARLGSRPHVNSIREMMGGSDHIILKDGQLCNINNPDVHPRTFMGISADGSTVYSVVVDGRYAGSAGINLDDQGRVLQWLGAWHGINLDGGGSTCMVVNGDIRNHNSDGSERAVGNGVLYYSLAPVDDEVDNLAFEPINYRLPASSRMRPRFYGFNQFGVLKTRDLADVTLTCDPEIGTIDSEGRFVAAGKPATGNLYATYGEETVAQSVTIVDAVPVLAYQSCVIDDRADYDIALTATVGNKKFDITPTSFDWTVADPSVVEVIDGKLHALRSGVTTVTGRGEGFECTLTVNSEIVEGTVRPWETPFIAEGWTLKQTGGTGITATPLDEGLKLTFKGNAVSRNANITMSKKDGQVSYGLPVGVNIDINPGDVKVTGMTIAWSNATGAHGNWTIAADKMPLPANELTSISVPLSDIMDVTNNNSYPVKFSSIRLNTGANERDKEFTIEMPSLCFLYNESGSVDAIINDSDRTLGISYAGGMITVDTGMVGSTLTVCDLAGAVRFNARMTSESVECQLAKGIYIATSGGKAAKFVVR